MVHAGQGGSEGPQVPTADSKIVSVAPLLSAGEGPRTGLVCQGEQQGVDGQVEQYGREWAALFKSVPHANNNIVGLEEDGLGDNIGEEGANGMDGPGWEADVLEQRE